MDPPRRPADRRPDDEPHYVDTVCDECGAELTPHPEAFELGWYDEFECDCEGIRMDWPQAEFDMLVERVEGVNDGDFATLED